MTEHYYSQKPETESSPKRWYHTLKGKPYHFISDDGVFSKRNVDFGSHLLIEQFKEPDVPGDILDLGCGYGPIGIVLADTCPGRHVIMSDINERALDLSKQNAQLNNVDNISIVKRDGIEGFEERSFAAIVTNPPIRAGKQVVHGMFEASRQQLVHFGELWVVIQKKQGAPSARKHLRQLFGDVEIVARSKGYYILRAINI